MCGVVDNDVAFEVFGDRRTGAGKGFRDWLDSRRGSLAVGGDLLDELAANGARLLYTNDNLLMDDFRNRNIVPGPPGKIYTTGNHQDFRPAHKRLLRMKNLCRAPGHG